MTADVRLIPGDCLKVLPTLPADSADSLVTDPPAGIAFMGKEWDDARAWQYEVSGHGFTDGGKRLPAPAVGTNGANPTCRNCGKRQRTWKGGPVACACDSPAFDNDRRHRDARAVFIAFLTAAMRESIRVLKPGAYGLVWAIPRTSHWTATALEDAGFEIRDRVSHLFGQGFPKAKSCLKPACEDWWLVRKPGRRMGPLQIDACRVAGVPPSVPQPLGGTGKVYGFANGEGRNGEMSNPHPAGRWPANVVLDETAAAMLDAQAGPQKSGGTPARRFAAKTKHAYGDFNGQENPDGIGRSAGNVSRFFYCPKASKADRGEGNTHPTVKNTALMDWLIRLITPPGGTVLDPFMGSGSTGKAAVQGGWSFVGVEQNADYFAIAEGRIAQLAEATRP